MTSSRAGLLALLLLGATACGRAAAAPVPPPPVPSAAVPAVAPPSVQLVQRLDAQRGSVMPSVVGERLDAATSRLAGLTVTVVSFGDDTTGGKQGAETVSSQWPAAGDGAPSDGEVVLWVGTPPKAPERKPQAAVVKTVEPEAAQTEAGEPAPAEPPAETQAPAVVQPGGVTPGLERFVPPPHGPRTNIRTLAPGEAGTALRGQASWYGPGFAGHQTACGTVFDPGQLTLASRELRCGTSVTVTGPTGRSVTAVVTDWGPAEWTGRRFDLSQATFAAIAGLGAGVTTVTVEVR